MSEWTMIGLPLALLAVALWLAGVERTVWGLDAAQLRTLGIADPLALQRIERLRAHPRALLSGIWIVGAAVHCGLAAVVLPVLWLRLPGPAGWIVAALLALGVAWCAHVIPAVAVRRDAVGVARRCSGLYLLLAQGTAPLGIPLQWAVTQVMRAGGAALPRGLTEEEFLTGVEVGGAQGVLRDDESGMVEGILGLEETQASEVMTPRVDLVGVSADAPDSEWLRIARSVRYRHLPVYRGSIDTIEGMLDLVKFLLDPAHDRVAAVVPPLFVAESAPLDELLVTLQRRAVRSAVVLDEYGGTAGLITRGDILEEITADVTGEYEPEAKRIQTLGDGSWLVDGTLSLDDLNDELGFALHAEGADRIAGWAAEHAGRLLRLGDSVASQGCRATVRRVRKHRIVQLHIERLPVPVVGDAPAPSSGEVGA